MELLLFVKRANNLIASQLNRILFIVNEREREREMCVLVVKCRRSQAVHQAAQYSRNNDGLLGDIRLPYFTTHPACLTKSTQGRCRIVFFFLIFFHIWVIICVLFYLGEMERKMPGVYQALSSHIAPQERQQHL